MKQLYPDLYQTTPEYPLADFPNVISFAYLLVRDEGNVLFYTTGREALDVVDDEADLQQMQELGGVARQYLGHWHEAVPSIARVKETLGGRLYAHALEEESIRQASGVEVDVTFHERETHLGDIEVIPTPGHTPGSTTYLYRSPHGKTYLFVGDLIGVNAGGVWENGYLANGESSKSELQQSLELLRSVEPDVVFPAAAYENHPYTEVSPSEWKAGVDEALRPLL